MKTGRIVLLIGISTLAVTAGCSSKPKIDDAQHWQRANVSEAAYINGPKAQQLLNRDIARCVTELRELEQLGQLKNAIPTNTRGRILNPDEKELRSVDSPEREGYLFAEHKNYHNFEGCMDHAGWERARTLTYAAIERAKTNYYSNHVDFKNGGSGVNEDVYGERASVPSAGYND